MDYIHRQHSYMHKVLSQTSLSQIPFWQKKVLFLVVFVIIAKLLFKYYS